MSLFQDRTDAGKKLAPRLMAYATKPDVVVLGLPRGGVPVADEVAHVLAAPLDVFVVRKLGVPGHRELAMGAIASGDVIVYNDPIIQELNIPQQAIERVIDDEKQELNQREKAYRGDRSVLELAGKTVILVDDGLATGATMRAAVQAVRSHHPARLVVAVPVGSVSACQEIAETVDEMVCLATPDPFWAVGSWYSDFSQTTDADVRQRLAKAETESKTHT